MFFKYTENYFLLKFTFKCTNLQKNCFNTDYFSFKLKTKKSYEKTQFLKVEKGANLLNK